MPTVEELFPKEKEDRNKLDNPEGGELEESRVKDEPEVKQGKTEIEEPMNPGNQGERNSDKSVDAPTPVANPGPPVLRIEVAPVDGAQGSGQQGQQTVVVGGLAAPAPSAGDDQKEEYLSEVEGYCGLNTAMLLSTRESIRSALIERDCGFFESLEDYPTIEDRRKRLPFDDDPLFDVVAEMLGDWREGTMSLAEAYGGVAFALENPERIKAIAAGEEEEEEEEEE